MRPSARESWTPTTHAWSSDVNAIHLADVRRRARELTPTGPAHLLCEVLAYADDEAAETERMGNVVVTLIADGWVAVADDGRGTDTRFDADGRAIRKPIMATKDLRFFDAAAPPILPDGAPRRGMSVVAALAMELVHENRRATGAWSQTYRHGNPDTELRELPPPTHRGTTIRYRPDPILVPGAPVTTRSAVTLAASFPHLHVSVESE